MTTMAAHADLSTGDKRRLRLVLETYLDLVDSRIRADHRILNYSDYEGLVSVVGEDEADKLKRLGMEAYRKEIKKYKKDAKDLKTWDPKFHKGFSEANAALSGDDAHARVNDLMRKQEAICVSIAKQKVKDLPMWTDWLQYVKGIGPVFTAGLVSWFDPRISPHASAWWKYAGLSVVVEKWECPMCKHEVPHDPAFQKTPVVHCPKCKNAMVSIGHSDRRQKGVKSNFNTRAKVLMWKISGSFVKQSAKKSGYRRLYDKWRAIYEERPCRKVHLNEKKQPIPCFAGHKHAKASRMVAKLFLSHAHTMYRKLLGLPCSDPYAFMELGHDRASMIEPIFDEKKSTKD